MNIGGSRNQPEIDVIAAQGNLSGRIARSQREGPRRGRERLLHETAIDANHAVIFDLRPRGPHDLTGLR